MSLVEFILQKTPKGVENQANWSNYRTAELSEFSEFNEMI